MFGFVVRPVAERVFADVALGRTDRVLRAVTDDVEHRFVGDNALSGERRGKDELRLWLERLHRLVPRIRFHLDTVAVSGPAWAATMTVEWEADLTPVAGPPYRNRGTHVIRTRGSRVCSIHAYEDSQLVDERLARMRSAGVEEASAPLIGRPLDISPRGSW